MPQIDGSVGRVGKEYANEALAFWDSAFVLAYNTKAIAADQAPSSLEDFTKPQYKGKVTINGTTACRWTSWVFSGAAINP